MGLYWHQLTNGTLFAVFALLKQMRIVSLADSALVCLRYVTLPKLNTSKVPKGLMKNSIRTLFIAFILFSVSTLLAQDKAAKDYVGQYISSTDRGFDITVSLNNENVLMAQPSDKSQPLTEMVEVAGDKYELKNTKGLRISFTRNKEGVVISLTFEGGNRKFEATKKTE